jgi:hypothetical protein
MTVASQVTSETVTYPDANESDDGARQAGTPQQRIDQELSNVYLRQALENPGIPTVAHEHHKIITFPHFVQHIPASPYRALKRWEGTVVAVRDEKEFISRLRNLDNPSDDELQAVISFEEITDSDRPLVEEGAVFYWTIGYLTDQDGHKHSVGTIRFRRLPVWTATEVARINEFASDYDALPQENSEAQ